MYKKRGDVVRYRNKRAQITIFIIIGLMIVFVFLFILQLTTKIQKGHLEEIKEQVLSKSFKKEALRIFVEDCLTDELENGLILIGKQGRLWADQPGGTKVFEEGVTGVNYNRGEPAGRIFYGITKEEYPTEENAFPCGNESNSPEFCRYRYPDTQAGFGNLELRPSTLQNDLRRFLINRTTWCVENFTKTNISSEAVVETEAISLKMEILDNGIDVEVDYPLKLVLGKEDFFHLSEFDFFYPTQFKALLDSALALPSRMDWKYVDFNYTKETMESTHFTHASEIETRDCSLFENEIFFLCNLALPYDKYSSIGVQMRNQTLPNGDDLFIFEAAPYSILNSPEKFEYRFLRQNRPPALDYVSRLECPQAGYDYLVIKGKEGELGEIDITLNAKDADEDTVSYGVNGGLGDYPGKDKLALTTDNIPKGFYNIIAYAIDGHGKQDWQEVRVLVDREAELDISLNVPYKFKPKEDDQDQSLRDYENLFKENYYYISNEDPIFVDLTYPSDSIAPTLSHTQVKFEYSNEDNDESFEFGFEPTQESTNNCFSFPWSPDGDCDLDNYKEEISNWKENLVSRLSLSKKSNPPATNYFQETTDDGVLSVSFSTEYCAAFGDSGSAEANIIVKDCLPHANLEHPFASPYQGYKFEKNDDGEYEWTGEKDAEINPFLATHSCCSGVSTNPAGWALKPAGAECFRNPEPGCYGGIKNTDGTPWTALKPGYILEQEIDTCGGSRGNVCGSPDGSTKKNDLWEGELRCGSSDSENEFFGQSCKAQIPTACQGELSWSYVDANGDGIDDAWCRGDMGCSALCQKPEEVVFDDPLGASKLPSSKDINELAKMKSPKPIDDDGTDFHCGCKIGSDAGKPCDSNFDGNFNGVCEEDTNGCRGDK